MPTIRLCAFSLTLYALGCQPAADSSSVGSPHDAPPIDGTRISSVEQAAAWPHRHSIEADLDADGAPEHLVLTVDVAVSPDGHPLWEDGHRWAAFVVEPDTTRTLLYAAFVPNGHVEAAVEEALAAETPEILLLERSPRQVRLLEVRYDGPGRVRTVSAARYYPQVWVPGLHRNP